MIKFQIPEKYFNEIEYVLYVLFQYWGKQDCFFEVNQKESILCTIEDSEIEFKSHFFSKVYKKEKIDYKLRNSFLFKDDLITLLFPYNYGIRKAIDYTKVDLDIFGSAFILLTGYESKEKQIFDKFGRFEGKNSELIDLIERPVVQEYYFFLKDFMKRFGLELQVPNFKAIATHDVDHPYQSYKLDFRHFLKNCAGDILLRKKLPTKRIKSYLKQDRDIDAFNTFDYLNEKEKSIESLYYFYAGDFSKDNPDYSIKDEHIYFLIKKIESYAKVGIHFGLGCYLSQEQVNYEIKNFPTKNLKDSRFHFLSFDSVKTVNLLESTTIKYDSTFAFRDYAGFRTGSCYPYPLFDLENRKMTNVVEKPLLMMESTILENKKLYPNPKKTIKNLINETKKYCGEFIFLWHNHRLCKKDEVEMYEFLLKELGL